MLYWLRKKKKKSLILLQLFYSIRLLLDDEILLSFFLRLEPPALGIIFKADNPETAAKPVQFTKVAQIAGRGFDEIFFWFPVAPPGYVTLGCVVSRSEEPPSSDLFCCPRMDLVKQANIFEVPISRSSSSRTAQCWSIWRVENQVQVTTNFFFSFGAFNKENSLMSHQEDT